MSVFEARRHDPVDPDRPDVVVASRRTVNDAIAHAASRFNLDEGNLVEFLCECGDLRCRQMIKMTLTEFWATGADCVGLIE